ncbi:MAG: polysaccharide biosynthesis protein [Ruthenibacterium lactatiformans]
MESTVFAGKTLLITGGTGSFGNTVLKHFYPQTSARSASFPARKKQTICHDYQPKYPELSGKIKFYIGDVRNPDSLRGVMRGDLYLPCGRAQAGSELRVLSHGGRAHQRAGTDNV